MATRPYWRGPAGAKSIPWNVTDPDIMPASVSKALVASARVATVTGPRDVSSRRMTQVRPFWAAPKVSLLSSKTEPPTSPMTFTMTVSPAWPGGSGETALPIVNQGPTFPPSCSLVVPSQTLLPTWRRSGGAVPSARPRMTPPPPQGPSRQGGQEPRDVAHDVGRPSMLFWRSRVATARYPRVQAFVPSSRFGLFRPGPGARRRLSQPYRHRH